MIFTIGALLYIVGKTVPLLLENPWFEKGELKTLEILGLAMRGFGLAFMTGSLLILAWNTLP